MILFNMLTIFWPNFNQYLPPCTERSIILNTFTICDLVSTYHNIKARLRPLYLLYLRLLNADHGSIGGPRFYRRTMVLLTCLNQCFLNYLMLWTGIFFSIPGTGALFSVCQGPVSQLASSFVQSTYSH